MATVRPTKNGIKTMHMTQRRWVVLSFCLASGCFNAPGGSAKGVFAKISGLFSGATTSGPDQQAVSGTLAIGESMIAELGISLRELGLTEAQIVGVQESARKELKTGVVAIQAGNLSLNVNMVGLPVEYAAPAVVRGAVAGLALLSATENSLKTSAVQTIVGTSFKSLSGNTGGLPTATLESLATTMAGGAVSKLTDAGFTADLVGDATKSVTSGSIANLQAAGISTDAVANVAKAVVTGAVQQLATIDLPATSVAAAVAGATEGAVASITATGLDATATVTLAGTLTAASVESLTVFKSLDQSTLVNTMKEISTSAVEALATAKIDSAYLGPAVKSIASASVAAVATVSEQSGLGASLVTSGAAALAAGAISGLNTVAADATVAASATENIISGTMSSLAQSTVLSTADKSTAAATVVGKSVEALSNLSSEATKTSVMSSVIGSTMANLSTLGIASDAQVAAETVKAITTNATSALVSAGFSSSTLSSATQTVVSSAVKGIDTLSVTGASAIGNLVSNVISGVSAGITTLTRDGKADENAAVAAINSSTQTATATVSTLQVASNLSAGEIASVNAQATAAVPASVTYPSTSLVLFANVKMSTLTPTKSGSFTSCTSTPNLPAGLTLGSDCSISGTPTTVFSEQKYTITPAGGLAASLTIRVSSNLPTIAYSNTDFEFVGGNAAGTIVPQNLGPTFDSCVPNQPMPPGLTLGPNCAITGSVNLFTDSGYDPIGAQELNLDGTPATMAAGGGDGPKYGFKYRVPYTITPKNGATVGVPVNITLTLVPPFTIYDSYALHLDGLTGVSVGKSISPQTPPASGASCSVTPSLPTGFNLDATTCKITASPTANVADAIYSIALSSGAGTPSVSKILLGASFYSYAFDYQNGNGQTFFVNQYRDMIPQYGSSPVPSTCVKVGTLPTGLTLGADCKISGTISSRFSNRELTIYPGSATTGRPVKIYLSSKDEISVSETVTNNSVTLSWPPVTGVTGYLVLARQGYGGLSTYPKDGMQITAADVKPGELLVGTVMSSGTSAAPLTITHSNLTQGDTYTYEIHGFDSTYNYTAFGSRYGVNVSLPTYNGSYPHRNLNLVVGKVVSEQPNFSPTGTPSGCTAAPSLTATGLTLMSDCKIQGTPTIPSGYRSYTITPSGNGIWNPLEVWLGVDGPLNVSASSSGTSVNITWPAVNEASGYVVLAHKNGPVETNLTDYFAVATQKSANDILVNNSSLTSVQHSSLTVGDSYSYKVYAYRDDNGSPNYFAVGATGQVVVGSTPAVTVSFSPRIRSFKVGDTVSIAPSVTGGVLSGCTVSPQLPAGLSLNSSTCTISGTTTAPKGLATYTITPTVSTGSHPPIELALRVWEDLTVNVDDTKDGYTTVSLSTSVFPGSLNYIFFVSDTDLPSSESPADFEGFHDGQETKWGRVAQQGPSPTFVHEGAEFNKSYYYKVFAKMSGYVGSGYLSMATSSSYAMRNKFEGVQDTYLAAPYSGYASGTSAIAISAQPHKEFANEQLSSFNSYIAIGTGSPSFSPEQTNLAITTTGSTLSRIWSSVDRFFFQLKSIVGGFESTSAVRAGVLDLFAGRHHKILGRNRFLGEDWSQLQIGTPTAITSDGYGNIIFASSNGTVNVYCEDNIEVPYCRGRQIKRVYTLAGADGGFLPGNASYSRPAPPWNPWQPLGKVSSLAVDRFYNVYIADAAYHQIFALCMVGSPGAGACANQSKGSLVVVAGNGSPGAVTTGVNATSTAMGEISQVVVDNRGNVIFAQSNQPQVYILCQRMDGPTCSQPGVATGKIYTLTGNGTLGDGLSSNPGGVVASTAAIGQVGGLAVDEAGSTYIADTNFNRILVVCGSYWYMSGHPCTGKSNGTLVKFAGDGTLSGSGSVGKPGPLYSDRGGNLFVFDTQAKLLRAICSSANSGGACKGKSPFTISQIGLSGAGDSPGEIDINNAMVDTISGIAVDNHGNVILADSGKQKLRVLCFDPSRVCDGKNYGKHYVIAGSGVMALMDTTDRGINTPLYTRQFSTAVDPQTGNIYISDPARGRVYVECLNNQVAPCLSTNRGDRRLIAGSGVAGAFQGDGTSRYAANLPTIAALAFSPGGNLVFSTGPTGEVYVICLASGGVNCATADKADNIYKIVSNGSVGKPGPLAADANGNLFIYDFLNYKLYQKCFNSAGTCGGKPAGSINLLAGDGTQGDGTDDVGINSRLMKISQIAVSTDDNLILADHGANRLRLMCLNAYGKCSGLTADSIYRWAGDGTSGAVPADGTDKATFKLGKPSGVAVTNSGDVLVQTAINPGIFLICTQSNNAPCSGKTVGSVYRVAGTGVAGNGPSNVAALDAPMGPVTAADAELEFGRLGIHPWTGHVYSADGDARAIRLFTGIGR